MHIYSLVIRRRGHISPGESTDSISVIRYVFHWRISLRRRHNERDGVANHQPHDCLVSRLFRHRWKKTSKLRVTGLCQENSPETGEFPAQWPVTRKMFPFDDVIMLYQSLQLNSFYIMVTHHFLSLVQLDKNWQWIFHMLNLYTRHNHIFAFDITFSHLFCTSILNSPWKICCRI